MLTTNDVRNIFKNAKKYNLHVVEDKTGTRVIELMALHFKADEPCIFGTVNSDWNSRELEWYDSQSLDVNDIPPPVPAVWRQVASKHGFINSNYGYLIYSKENYKQYDNVLKELKANPFSRRAIMIYTRPSMHEEYGMDGMSDFICTNTVQYLVRDGSLHAIVNMRSNDAIYGYKGDYAWQEEVLIRLATDLGIPPGDIWWSVGSMHIYEKHWNLIE